MSLPTLKITNGATLPVKPAGNMLNGWLPGTIVDFIYNSEDPSGKNFYVDWASKYPTNVGAGGFTINGSLKFKNGFDITYPNNNEPSGYWTPDEQIQYTKGDENKVMEFDNRNQLSYMGKDMLTINYDGGCFKIYTFEKYDEDYLASNGVSGDVIDWKANVGKLLGVSSRSLFTTVDNNVISEPYEYRLGGVFKDENGKDYIVAIRR